MVLGKIRVCYLKTPYALRIALATALVAKVAVFALGYAAAYGTVASHGSSTEPLGLFMNMFAKWDSPHYMFIAQHWYTNKGDIANFIVFFPLYPILVRLITFNFSYINLSGLIVSNVASIVAVVYLFKLAKLDYGDSVAKKAVLFLCVFPTAYFLSAVYTESLFIALVIASFYYARNVKWPLAGFLGLLASLSRLWGLIMLPALFVEFLHQENWKFKAFDRRIFWLVLPAIGFLIYLGINFQVTGSFFTFLRVQSVHWYENFDPLGGYIGAFGWARNGPYPSNITLGYAEIIFAAFGYAMIGVGYKLKLRPSYQVYNLLTWMLAFADGFWISGPRYVLTMFPMFLALGMLATKRPVEIAILAVSCAGLFFFTWLFATGTFAF